MCKKGNEYQGTISSITHSPPCTLLITRQTVMKKISFNDLKKFRVQCGTRQLNKSLCYNVVNLKALV